MSKVFKISHYSSQNEKRVLEPKEIKRMVPFVNFDHSAVVDGEETSQEEVNEIITQAQTEANKLLNQVHIEISELKESAQLEINAWKEKEQKLISEESARLYRKAKEDGYKEGHQIGLDEGTKAAHHQFTNYIDQASSIVRQAEVDWQKRMQQSEPFLVELASEVAKKIIQRELRLDHHTLLGMVAETLKLSSELKEITLCVHPDDYHLVKSSMDDLKSLISSQANLILLPDHMITSGGCIIRSSLGTLDARVDTQLEEIKLALLDAIKGSELDELESTREI